MWEESRSLNSPEGVGSAVPGRPLLIDFCRSSTQDACAQGGEERRAVHFRQRARGGAGLSLAARSLVGVGLLRKRTRVGSRS